MGKRQHLLLRGDPENMTIMGEKPTHMDKPNMLKMVKTMLTNKAVGE